MPNADSSRRRIAVGRQSSTSGRPCPPRSALSIACVSPSWASQPLVAGNRPQKTLRFSGNASPQKRALSYDRPDLCAHPGESSKEEGSVRDDFRIPEPIRNVESEWLAEIRTELVTLNEKMDEVVTLLRALVDKK